MLTKLLERVTRRRTQQKLTTASDVRQAIILSRAAEDGDATEIDEQHFARIVEESGLTDADLAATETVYLKRIEAAPLAAKVAKLSAAGEIAEKTWRLFDEQEGVRRRKALAELERLNIVMRTTLAEAQRAVVAENFLRDTAATAKEEQALQVKLSPRLHPATPAFYLPSIRENPGAVVAHSKREIEQLSKRSDPQAREQIKTLEERQCLAEQAVVGLEKEIAALNKEREQINHRLRQLAGERLKPENFAIVRAKPSRDAQQKQHAREIGYAAR